jgi:hypothetical protein
MLSLPIFRSWQRPPEAMPREAMPRETMPRETMPRETMPRAWLCFSIRPARVAKQHSRFPVHPTDLARCWTANLKVDFCDQSSDGVLRSCSHSL